MAVEPISVLVGYVANKTIYEVSKDAIVDLFSNSLKTSIEEKIAGIVKEPFLSALDHLSDAKHDLDNFNYHIEKARLSFLKASNIEISAESITAIFYVGVCFDLLGNPSAADSWYQKIPDAVTKLQNRILSPYIDTGKPSRSIFGFSKKSIKHGNQHDHVVEKIRETGSIEAVLSDIYTRCGYDQKIVDDWITEVYFAVEALADYGSISKISIKHRNSINTYKKGLLT